MKVLFANPPTFEKEGSFNRPVRFPTYNYATPVLHPPIFLACGASYLRERGHEVTFIDAQADRMSVERFLERTRSISPDFVVFETSTPSLGIDSRIAELVKRACGANMVFVGTHVSALPEESLRETAADAVVMGEYELSLEEYVRKGGKGTRGVCYRDGRDIIRNRPREYIENLDSLPWPARDLLPNYKYFDPILKNPFTFVFAGRGCPHKCTFCNWPQVMTGRRYRFRSPKSIADELEHIQNEYRFASILFNDDTFTADREHVFEVCDEIDRRGLKMEWACYTRADNSDRELLRRMRESGCFLLKVGIESGNQKVLNAMRKGYRLERVREGVRAMKEMGFHVHGTFVFGLPCETRETIRETISFANETRPTTVQFSTAVPYPGTEFYDYLKSNGYLNTNDWKEFMPLNPVFSYENLSSEDLRDAVKKAYRSYYFRPETISVAAKEFFTQPRVLFGNAVKLIRLVS
jgi:anaerobic magnesium-protoporphyrin IX monomethyl ester cyclase